METLRKALEACERANVKLQQATKAKSDFLANVTHELRTPMHGIIAMSRELQDLLPPKTKAREAVTIISSTKLMTMTTRDRADLNLPFISCCCRLCGSPVVARERHP